MSIVRNALAVVGAVTVARYAYVGFKKYVRGPLTDLVTEAIDRERERTDEVRGAEQNVRDAQKASEEVLQANEKMDEKSS